MLKHPVLGPRPDYCEGLLAHLPASTLVVVLSHSCREQPWSTRHAFCHLIIVTTSSPALDLPSSHTLLLLFHPLTEPFPTSGPWHLLCPWLRMLLPQVCSWLARGHPSVNVRPVTSLESLSLATQPKLLPPTVIPFPANAFLLTRTSQACYADVYLFS